MDLSEDYDAEHHQVDESRTSQKRPWEGTPPRNERSRSGHRIRLDVENLSEGRDGTSPTGQPGPPAPTDAEMDVDGNMPQAVTTSSSKGKQRASDVGARADQASPDRPQDHANSARRQETPYPRGQIIRPPTPGPSNAPSRPRTSFAEYVARNEAVRESAPCQLAQGGPALGLFGEPYLGRATTSSSSALRNEQTGPQRTSTPCPTTRAYAPGPRLQPLLHGHTQSPFVFGAPQRPVSPVHTMRTPYANQERSSGPSIFAPHHPAHPTANQEHNTPHVPRRHAAPGEQFQDRVGINPPQNVPIPPAQIPVNIVPPLAPALAGGAPSAIFRAAEVPEGGWNTVHYSDPEQPLRGVSARRVQEIYSANANEVLLAEVFNQGYPASSRTVRETADAMTAVIQELTGQTPTIVPPELEDSTIDIRDAPTTWIIYGLTPGAMASLRQRAFVTAPAISFRVFHRDLFLPYLVVTLGDFLTSNQGLIERMVRENLQGPLRQSIATLVERNPTFAHITTDQAITRVMDTLRVRVLTLSNGNIIANVFLQSPTHSMELWRAWVVQLRIHAWRAHDHRTVFARRITHCEGCHGADHPTHLCPFPHAPGWNGPMAGTAPPAPAAPHTAQSEGERTRTGPKPGPTRKAWTRRWRTRLLEAMYDATPYEKSVDKL
ncbi:hypothetical protein C8Q76DRAFT_688237 [Earliella scabrosa]|nr:hypothetical protein C8Q76DRAFT_688237 [Earliella scabrosa]